MKLKTLSMCMTVFMLGIVAIQAQQESRTATEQRVSLTQAAIALDATGASALEATLRTTALNGAPDAPVTNIRVVVKNVSSTFLTYASGLVITDEGGSLSYRAGIGAGR